MTNQKSHFIPWRTDKGFLVITFSCFLVLNQKSEFVSVMCCGKAGPTHLCWSYSALLKAQSPLASSNNNNNKIINHISVPDLTMVEFLSLGFCQSSLWFQLDPYRIVCIILCQLFSYWSVQQLLCSQLKAILKGPPRTLKIAKFLWSQQNWNRNFVEWGMNKHNLVLNIGLRWN